MSGEHLPNYILRAFGRGLRGELKDTTEAPMPTEWLVKLTKWAATDILKNYENGKRRDTRFNW